MMKPSKNFSNRAILSLVSGKLFCANMDSVYALARHLSGHEIAGMRVALQLWRKVNLDKLDMAFPEHALMDTKDVKDPASTEAFKEKHKDWLALVREVAPIPDLKAAHGTVLTIEMDGEGPPKVRTHRI